MSETDGQRLILKETPGRGRGVYAGQDFAKGEVIERVPVLLLPPEQRRLVAATLLKHYYFKWAPYKGVVAIALGYGSLYNHSRTPKAEFLKDLNENQMEYIAVEPIAAGEEITINYGKHTFDPTPMWFEPDGPKPIVTPKRAAAVASVALVALILRRRRRSRGDGGER